MKLRSMTWQYVIPHAASEAAAQPELLMDDEAFAAFYQRTARHLWAYVARVCGNPTLADDLVQESFLRFLGADLRDDGEVAWRRYLFRIATNLMRDHWRKPSPSAIEDLPESLVPGIDARADERLDSEAVLAAAMERLAPLQRQLLWLAYAEGASHQEIAEITGLRVTSVRVLLFRARQKMARLLRQPPMEKSR